MKLFWKLFCCMVLLAVLGSSAGGYLLIDAQFRTSLERETEALYQENDLLRYALNLKLGTASLVMRDQIDILARNIAITSRGKTVSFRISSGEGEDVGGAGTLPVDAGELVTSLDKERRGWELREAGGRYYLHAASPLELMGETMYLESCREVTSLFEQRAEQYRNLLWLIPSLAGAAAALSLAAAGLILRPLNRLSAAARRLAGGELDQRVAVTGDDELARLSRDFNTMASRLEEQVEELKAVARRQEDFIGSFAHELKTPLTSIIGYAELLRARPEDRDRVLESAGYIFREGRRLEALSRKLLDLIVLEREDVDRRKLPLDAFLERVGGAVRPALEGAGVRLTVRSEAGELEADPDLLEAVLLNLVDNARKAGSGEICLEGFSDGDGCRVTVTDDGKGIPPEELDRVTEAFYMVDKSRARAQGGAGLGLALCRRIVELHGGELALASEPGRGTKVTVTLRGEGRP